MKVMVKKGVPIARRAREYGGSHQSIYNLLAAVSSPAKERKARGSKLEPFKSHFVSRLARFDLPAATLFEAPSTSPASGGRHGPD